MRSQRTTNQPASSGNESTVDGRQSTVVYGGSTVDYRLWTADHRLFKTLFTILISIVTFTGCNYDTTLTEPSSQLLSKQQMVSF
ncbi:MAG: hypothetical protein WA960_12215, partial [Tunicatimonas sp.]